MRKTKFENDACFNLDMVYLLEKEGKNLKEIANILNMDEKTFQYRLKKLNIKLKTCRSKSWKNHTFLDEIDSEEKAYMLGFIVADGCIRKEITKQQGITQSLLLCNSVDDIEIITLFQKVFYNNENFTTVVFKNKKDQCRFRITSEYLTNILINKYKILPNKTNDFLFEFPFEKIPKEFHRDFVRGFFDGDGCICNYSKSNLKRISFVFTSKIFMNQILDIFSKEIPELNFSINCKKGKTIDNYYIISGSLGKGKLNDIIDYFYKNATIFLKRKFNKFNEQNIVLNSKITKGLESA